MGIEGARVSESATLREVEEHRKRCEELIKVELEAELLVSNTRDVSLQDRARAAFAPAEAGGAVGGRARAGGVWRRVWRRGGGEAFLTRGERPPGLLLLLPGPRAAADRAGGWRARAGWAGRIVVLV